MQAFALKAQFGPPLVFPGIGIGRVLIQKEVKLASGDLEPLINVKRIYIKYDYSSMTVCKFGSEQEYIEDLKKHYSAKKAVKKIDRWKKLPANFLEPGFESLFNRYAAKLNIHSTPDSTEAQATLIVKVIKEEPHRHGDLSTLESRPYIILECTFLNKEGYFIARLELSAIGSHENTLTQRLEDCFQIAGKLLAKDLVKRIKQIQK